MALPRKISEENKSCCLDPQIKRGMNPKKQHEVSHMSALINDISVRTGCDVVIDVGSGLVCITLNVNALKPFTSPTPNIISRVPIS